MSFQLSTATALPAEIQLAKEKPQGTFALRTRYALSANSANSWSAGTLVSLPLQTGTPGTFTDVKQGCINATIQINNTNPYVDYLNFGPSGAMIFFDEMRVYSSGTPVEENLRYSETVDLMMMQGGYQNLPYHVFRRNSWRANSGRAGDRHCNFIKPCMVDLTGTPMFGQTPLLDKNSNIYHPPAVSFGIAVPSFCTGTSTVDGGVYTQGNPAFVPYGAVSTTAATLGQIWGTDGYGTFNDGGIESNVRSGDISWSMLNDGNATANSGTSRSVGRNSSHISPGLYAGQVGTNTGSGFVNASDPYMWKNTQVAKSSSALKSSTSWLPTAQYVPSQWPNFQPCTLCGDVDESEIDLIIGKTKVSEYMKYLANVRSLPIGVLGSVAQNSNYQDSSVVLSPTIVGGSKLTEYRVSMPFLSGIYGILADKMFPDLLIGANNIRIEFKLATNYKALWTTMDPCRRVPGTVRDFVPFTGSASGSVRASTLNVNTSSTSRSSTGGNYDGQAKFAIGSSAFGCSNSGVCAVGSGAAGSAYAIQDGANTGVFGTTGKALTLTNGVSNGGIIPRTAMYNTVSAMGEDFVGIQQKLIPGAIVSEATSSSFIPLLIGTANVTALSLAISGGIATFTLGSAPTVAVAVGDIMQVRAAQFSEGEELLRVMVTGVTSNTVFTIQFLSPSIAPFSSAILPVSIVKAANQGIQYYVPCSDPSEGAGFHLSPISNLPKPQYMPCATPWLVKDFSSISNYVNENAVCYGTYLPAAVPQVRRCQPSSRLSIVDSYSYTGTTTFSIKDLTYIGEQVQLDDISASAIISHAATSEVVVWTRGFRSFEASCDTSIQQNIILPIQVGQATAMYLVFRPNAQIQSQDYYSNSFSCPFTGLSFSNSQSSVTQAVLNSSAGAIAGFTQLGVDGASVPDVGGIYQIQSSLDTADLGDFSYQLFSGTKQYPLQPIQTVAEMLVEKEKATHSLHNWGYCSTENMSLTAWGGAGFNVKSATGLEYNPFLDLGFFTTFIPIAALDDQTITANPYFALGEITESGTASLAPKIRGNRQPANLIGTSSNIFSGVLNVFTPPIGTFYLGWDFESWTNHEDLMRTGKFLGQEQLSIRMSGTYLCSATNPVGNASSSSTQVVAVTAIVPHVVKLSFMPGGHMLSYY